MRARQQTKRRTANLSLVVLSLAATLRCNVYNDSLLGHDQLAVGGGGTSGHSGRNAASAGAGRGGIAGESEARSGNGGFGGLDELAGAMDTGGSATNGGTAGAANVGGANGGTGGVAGTGGGGGGVGGTGGAHQTASGCARLSVPLDDSGDKAHFVIGLASTADLSGATISIRFFVEAGQGGALFNYVQDSGTYRFLGVPEANRQLLASASGWSTITWNVGAEPDSAGTGIVKGSIKSIGIEVNAQPSSSWSNPTVVYVDSINVTSPSLPFTFDAASSVSTTNVTGALWLNGNSQDTTATGSAVTWQATCP